jgi:hypothetical protein
MGKKGRLNLLHGLLTEKALAEEEIDLLAFTA